MQTQPALLAGALPEWAKGDGSGDPELDRRLESAKREFDRNKRKEILHDTQRYLAKAMYSVRWPGGASGFGGA